MGSFDKNLPSGAVAFNQGDNAIRDNNAALEERLAREHDFPQNPFTSRSGRHIFGVGTTAQRDAAITLPQAGNVWYNTDTVGWEVYNGASWQPGIFALNPEQIDDTSANATEQDVTLSPGDYAARTLATDLEEELHQLRFVSMRQSIGVATKRAASALAAGWLMQPARGQSRVMNGRFLGWDGVALNAPHLWTKVSTPTTLATANRATSAGYGREVHIVSDAAGEGIQQVISGLGFAKLYLLRVMARASAGAPLITTLGGSGATYGNANHVINSANDSEYYDVVLTDGATGQITIQILSAAAGNDFFVSEVDLIPLGDPRSAIEWPLSSTEFAQKNTFESLLAGAWRIPTNLTTAPLYVPALGYEISVDATVVGHPDANNDRILGVRIESNTNGGAFGAASQMAVGTIFARNTGLPGTCTIVGWTTPVTAGNNHAFRVAVYPLDQDWTISPSIVGPGQFVSFIRATLRKRL